METLTKESLYKAITKCQETNNYRVLIVTKFLASQNIIQQEWLRPTGIMFNETKNGINVRFDNGSIIRGISLSNNCRGYKANLVLCEDWMLEDDDINNRLRYFEIL